MPARRTALIVAGAVIAVGAAGFAVGSALDDPDSQVASISLTDAPSADVAGLGTNRQVAALDTLTGVVERDGDDVDDLEVNRVDLDFGPDSWVASAVAAADYDGDGNIESLRDELSGLVGKEITFGVRLDGDGDDADVYVINGLPYRDVSGPAPWQSADAAPEDTIRAAAAAAVGDGATVVDLEAEGGSAVAWEAEVVDRDGREFDVLLDAAGTVIDVRAD